MAKSSTERSREHRARKREAKKTPLPAIDELAPYLQSSFGDFLKDHADQTLFYETLHWCGVRVDVNLESDQPKLGTAENWRAVGIEPNSLNIATTLVDAFIEAAKELSVLINEYKLQEIDRAMETASPADQVRLEYMRKPLTKRTSHFFPVIEVKTD